MKIGEDSSLSALYYFLAGALVPTITYSLFFRNNNTNKIQNIEFCDDDDDDEDDGQYSEENEDTALFDNPINSSNTSSKQWGITDAPYKMVLCVNTSLGMGKGKIAAQCCHAAVGCYKKATKICPGGLRAWEMTGCAKIAVKCPSEDEMMDEILVKAHQAGIPYYFVEDAGRTQIKAGSRTVLGLGPAPVRCFEGITSHLKLM